MLTGRIAVVTGGGSGIGRAIALELAGRGADVIAIGRRAEPLAQTAELATELPGHVAPLAVDLRDPACPDALDAALAALDDRAASAPGSPAARRPVAVLVNNAASYARVGPLEAVPEADLADVVATGLVAVLQLTRHLLPAMKAAGFGRIVHVGSVAGSVGAPGQTAYAAVKSALVGLTRSLALETAPFGITCNLLELGLIDTPRTRASLAPGMWEKLVASTPAGRPGTTQEVASAVAFLASDAAAFVTGATLAVSGGLGLGLVPPALSPDR